MNKMMKLLLVAEGCTLATMACEPGHWYVGGGVGMVYRTAKPKVKKVEISEGDKLYGVIVTGNNAYNPEEVSSERDAINDAIKKASCRGWNPIFALNARYERSIGHLNLGAELGVEVQSGSCSLKTTNELLFRRMGTQINPAGTYGQIKVPLSFPLNVLIGVRVSDLVGIGIKAGVTIMNTRVKVRKSLDNGAGIDPDNQEPGDVEKLQAAYNTRLTKSTIRAIPNIGAEIKFQIKDSLALCMGYDYRRYNAPVHKDALPLHGNPKIKTKDHMMMLKIYKVI